MKKNTLFLLMFLMMASMGLSACGSSTTVTAQDDTATTRTLTLKGAGQ